MKKTVLSLALALCFSGFAQQGYLGVVSNPYQQNNLQGARIINILDGGAAKVYGLQENDIILKINTTEITNSQVLQQTLRTYNWGDLVSVEYVRSGATYTKDVYLGYKADSKTYNVSKTKLGTLDQYWFSDDNTVIVMDNQTPVSVSKAENNCAVSTWTIGTVYSEGEVPQCYLDYTDKVAAILRIKEKQAEQGYATDQVIYKKILLESTTSTATAAISIPNTAKESLFTEFSVYPNPSTDGNFSVKLASNQTNIQPEITIFNITGQIVTQTKLTTFDNKAIQDYHLNNLASGTYLVQLKAGNYTSSKKLLIP